MVSSGGAIGVLIRADSLPITCLIEPWSEILEKAMDRSIVSRRSPKTKKGDFGTGYGSDGVKAQKKSSSTG